MLHGHAKIGQVPVSDIGTSKTCPENVPIAYQRENIFLFRIRPEHSHDMPGSSRTWERGKKRKIFSLSCSVLWVLPLAKPFCCRSLYISDQQSHSTVAKVLLVSFKIWIDQEHRAFCHGLWQEREQAREREREWRECSSLLDQKRLDRGNSMYHRAISVSRCVVFILVSIKWSIFIKKKRLVRFHFTFKPKHLSPNRHEPASQPIHTKAQIEI